MKTSKKIFLIVAIIFLVAMAFISYDISRRTTFPGSKPQLKERLQKEYIEADCTMLRNEKDSVISLH